MEETGAWLGTDSDLELGEGDLRPQIKGKWALRAGIAGSADLDRIYRRFLAITVAVAGHDAEFVRRELHRIVRKDVGRPEELGAPLKIDIHPVGMAIAQ